MKAEIYGVPVELQPDPEIKSLCTGCRHILRFENAEILMLMKFFDEHRKTPWTDAGPISVILNPDKKPEEISDCYMNAGLGFSGNKNGLKSSYFTPNIYTWPEGDEEETNLPLHVNPNGAAFTYITFEQDPFTLNSHMNLYGNKLSHFAIEIHHSDIPMAEYYEFRTEQIRNYMKKHQKTPVVAATAGL